MIFDILSDNVRNVPLLSDTDALHISIFLRRKMKWKIINFLAEWTC